MQDKEHFAKLAVDAVLRLKGATDLEAIHIIKKPGGTLEVFTRPLSLALRQVYTWVQGSRMCDPFTALNVNSLANQIYVGWVGYHPSRPTA